MANTFNYAKSYLQTLATESDLEISNFYMIGDNPVADIKGANDNGCVSILTRSGVFSGFSERTGKPIDNSELHPADYVVDNMYEAYKLILEREGLSDIIKLD